MMSDEEALFAKATEDKLRMSPPSLCELRRVCEDVEPPRLAARATPPIPMGQ
jgi:hypothetical protein